MAKQRKHIKVTYSTLGSPDPLLHEYFEEDVAELKNNLGARYKMLINGERAEGDGELENRSPINTDWLLGVFACASAAHVNQAVAAAKAAFPAWRATPWQERCDLLNRVADLISERLFEISAAVSMEIGKNRLEAIGDVEETADLIRYCVDAMRDNAGFDRQLLSESDQHFNRSVLKPYGVWGVIGPFNFPAALTGGPTGAALIAGNTVVLKPAAEGSLTACLIAQCVQDAGVPAGVFNMVLGGDEPGMALTAHPDLAGLTFTGSYDVGMSIIKTFSTAAGYFRPVIAEMGGKNPTIISANADLDKAALGVMRSAFGLTGQKCSACSRVYVEAAVKDEFLDKLVDLAAAVKVGDPTDADTYMGPIISADAYQAYQRYIDEMSAGRILAGGWAGRHLAPTEGKGYFVAPTVVADLPDDHRLWRHEMFAPIVAVRGVDSPEEAMRLANGVALGLTAGMYSEDPAEVEWFLDNIEAGVLYVNRATGATTGAWPGYQSFGGWKGSTGSNKAAGSWYYLQQYMREQSHTIVA
ncbi:MAG: aldehyde dehydrogenase family protein [Chloroflexota bacterium]|nr:aldehyde dehydrogenase family protein [Chloroflexota bacterium]MDE2946722.1 aldehyde dehydrogenase family protein [Chloroflexota bacterium]